MISFLIGTISVSSVEIQRIRLATIDSHMITVAAAIIEKDGRILAARKRPGLHLAGCWEFPGGKVERGETPQKCLQRELAEELGITCEIGAFFAESVYDYGSKVIRLLGYHATHTGGEFQLTDHDEICWLPVMELDSLRWAPADIPLVLKLTAQHITAQTLLYYNRNGTDYVRETINLNMDDVRERFLRLIPKNAHILDLGCGSGRDSRIFRQQGYTVTAIDASPTIARLTSTILGRQVRIQKAQEITEHEQYDAIWACASLVHIPDSEMAETLIKLTRALKPGGLLYMSFKLGLPAPWDAKGRFFNNSTLASLTEHIAMIPNIAITDHYETVGRCDTTPERWLNVFAKRSIHS